MVVVRVAVRATEGTDAESFKPGPQKARIRNRFKTGGINGANADKTRANYPLRKICDINGRESTKELRGSGIAIGVLDRFAANLMRALVGMAIAPIVRMVTTHNHVGDPRTYAIIGAAIEVHRVMGTGFLELLYKDALAIELHRREIPFEAEVPCRVQYKGHILGGNYRIDFVCFQAVVLEIKARSALTPADHAQLLSYLAAARIRHRLLLNFGTPRLEHRRFVLDVPSAVG